MIQWLCAVHRILSLFFCHIVTDGFSIPVHLSCLVLTVSLMQKSENLIRSNWWGLEWQHRRQWWVCRREDSTIHGTAVMSWNSPSVGVAGKCWAGKAKVSPTGLIWEERGAESSSKATDKKITITHNYSVNTVGKGALLPACIGSALRCDSNCSSPTCAWLFLHQPTFTALLKQATACLPDPLLAFKEKTQNGNAEETVLHI